MKKIFSIFIIATLTAIPAIADNITNSSMCVIGTLGQSNNDSTASINAIWSADTYPCSAGQYLYVGSVATNDEGTIECRTCPTGSYCGGGNYTVENHANDILSCSTVGNGTFTLSGAGSDANTDCYKTCSANCVQPTAPAHTTNVTYGNETSNGIWNYNSTCNAVAPTCSINFDCVTGYHKRPDLTRAQAQVLFLQMMQAQGQDTNDIPQSYIDEQLDYLFGNWDTFFASLSAAERNMVIQAIDTIQGHTHSGDNIWAPFDINAQNIVNNNSFPPIYIYSKNMNGVEHCRGLDDIDVSCTTLANQYPALAQFRQTAQNGDWFVASPEIGVSAAGHSQCNDNWDESGSTSPCTKTFTMVNGVTATSGQIYEFGDIIDGWNFKHSQELGDGQTCVQACAFDAADNSLREILLARIYKNSSSSTRMSSLYVDGVNISSNGSQYISYICDANVINLEWYDVGDNVYETNQCTYDSAITLPSTNPTRPGYTFTGWRLRQ